MPRGLEYIGGFVSSPGATLTTLTFSTGQSNVIRGTDATKGTWLLSTNAFVQTAGELRITSPRMHDQVQNIRNRVTANFSGPLTPGHLNAGYAQRLYAQDNITVQLSGDAGVFDIACLLVGYDDLQGIAGRFIDHPTLKKAGVNILTAEVTVTAGTGGIWAGAVAINSTFDNLIANTDYAIVGGMTDTRGGGVGITGVDLGNLRVGFPAEPSIRNTTQNWFQQLSLAFNAPYIPVINSANKSQTNIDVITTNAGGTFIVNLELVQLAPNAVPAFAPATAAGQQPGA